MPLTVEQLNDVADFYYGTYVATAAKRGRNASHPYVPIMRFAVIVGSSQTKQIPNRAFQTRGQAIDCAQRHIDDLRQAIKDRVSEPRNRALRIKHNLPEVI